MVMYKNILVPVDGSENSQRALKHAIELAKLSGSKLILAHVIDMNGVFNYPQATTSSAVKDLVSNFQKQSSIILNHAKNQAMDLGIDATTIQAPGSVKEKIATTIPNEYDIDLIVIGKTGRDALSRLVLGSTTAYVVRKAKANVTVVNMDD
ncbi:universal stress protein [Levilactobacillus brevis]|nr:universal stress protein [Levilactobacillus brevis]